MARFTGINHLAMVTGDMDMTIRFWRDLLGMRLVAGLGREGYRHYFFEISENDLLAFFEWPGVTPVPEKDHGYPLEGPVAFDHLSIGVENEDGLWEIHDKLRAAGFDVSGVVDHGFIHSIYAFDPNGIPIEFSANVPGVDVRKHPVMADLEPVQNAREGSEPVSGKWAGPASITPPARRRAFAGVGASLFSGKKEETPNQKF